MMKNASCLKAWLKRHPDYAIARHADWPPHGSIWIQWLMHQRTGGQVNPNLDKYHSNPMEMRSTFWLPDITDWWQQPEEAHSKFAGLSNAACDRFTIIPHGDGVEASSSLGWNLIGWRQSKTTGQTLWENVFVRQFAPASNGILAGNYTALDTMETENDLELKEQAEERKLHRMGKVHNCLGMWPGSQNLHAPQKESRAQNKQMTAIEYISPTEEIIRASWSNFQHDGAAGFKLTERLPLPPALSAKTLPGRRAQVLNVRWIARINCHRARSDEDGAHESFSDTVIWLNWNGDLDNPMVTDHDWEADSESNIEPDHGTKARDHPEHLDVSATPRFPG